MDGCMGCWPFSEHRYLGGHVEDGPVVYPANAFDSRLGGDLVPISSKLKSDKISKKKKNRTRKSTHQRRETRFAESN